MDFNKSFSNQDKQWVQEATRTAMFQVASSASTAWFWYQWRNWIFWGVTLILGYAAYTAVFGFKDPKTGEITHWFRNAETVAIIRQLNNDGTMTQKTMDEIEKMQKKGMTLGDVKRELPNVQARWKAQAEEADRAPRFLDNCGESWNTKEMRDAIDKALQGTKCQPKTKPMFRDRD